jgi:hypothetical protein
MCGLCANGLRLARSYRRSPKRSMPIPALAEVFVVAQLLVHACIEELQTDAFSKSQRRLRECADAV